MQIVEGRRRLSRRIAVLAAALLFARSVGAQPADTSGKSDMDDIFRSRGAPSGRVVGATRGHRPARAKPTTTQVRRRAM